MPTERRHKAPKGECRTCDEEREREEAVQATGRTTFPFHPSHDASHRCESGKHNHCSCDTCF